MDVPLNPIASRDISPDLKACSRFPALRIKPANVCNFSLKDIDIHLTCSSVIGEGPSLVSEGSFRKFLCITGLIKTVRLL